MQWQPKKPDAAESKGSEQLQACLPACSVPQLRPVMCKPHPPSPASPPTMENGNSSQIGAVNVDFFHGISFGSGAMAVILIVALFYIWLRCKKDGDSRPPPNGPTPCTHNCMRPAHSTIEMDAINTPRVPEAGGEEAVIRDFLRFSRLSNQISTTPSIEHNPYQMR